MESSRGAIKLSDSEVPLQEGVPLPKGAVIYLALRAIALELRGVRKR
jgi:hypothetical protein